MMNITATSLNNASIPVRRHKKVYVDTALKEKSSDIEQAVLAFEQKREARRIKDLRDTVSRIRSVPEEKCIDGNMLEMLEKIHLPNECIPCDLRRFDVLLKNRCISGVGYKNENGGISFFSLDIGGFTNIGAPGITIFYNKENRKSNSIYFFENFLDYIAFRYLMSIQKKTIDGDCLVLNALGNFTTAMLHCENYRQVFCFFHRNVEASVVMCKTVCERMCGVSRDMSYIYGDKDFDTILDMIASLHK